MAKKKKATKKRRATRRMAKTKKQLLKAIKSISAQADSLKRQLAHAIQANGEMAAHSRFCETALLRARLSFSEERSRNRGRLGSSYATIPEDWWFSQGAAAIKGKALVRLEGSKDLDMPIQIAAQLLKIELQSPTQPQLTHEKL